MSSNNRRRMSAASRLGCLAVVAAFLLPGSVSFAPRRVSFTPQSAPLATALFLRTPRPPQTPPPLYATNNNRRAQQQRQQPPPSKPPQPIKEIAQVTGNTLASSILFSSYLLKQALCLTVTPLAVAEQKLVGKKGPLQEATNGVVVTASSFVGAFLLIGAAIDNLPILPDKKELEEMQVVNLSPQDQAEYDKLLKQVLLPPSTPTATARSAVLLEGNREPQAPPSVILAQKEKVAESAVAPPSSTLLAQQDSAAAAAEPPAAFEKVELSSTATATPPPSSPSFLETLVTKIEEIRGSEEEDKAAATASASSSSGEPSSSSSQPSFMTTLVTKMEELQEASPSPEAVLDQAVASSSQLSEEQPLPPGKPNMMETLMAKIQNHPPIEEPKAPVLQFDEPAPSTMLAESSSSDASVIASADEQQQQQGEAPSVVTPPASSSLATAAVAAAAVNEAPQPSSLAMAAATATVKEDAKAMMESVMSRIRNHPPVVEQQSQPPPESPLTFSDEPSIAATSAPSGEPSVLSSAIATESDVLTGEVRFAQPEPETTVLAASAPGAVEAAPSVGEVLPSTSTTTASVASDSVDHSVASDSVDQEPASSSFTEPSLITSMMDKLVAKVNKLVELDPRPELKQAASEMASTAAASSVILDATPAPSTVLGEEAPDVPAAASSLDEQVLASAESADPTSSTTDGVAVASGDEMVMPEDSMLASADEPAPVETSSVVVASSPMQADQLDSDDEDDTPHPRSLFEMIKSKVEKLQEAVDPPTLSLPKLRDVIVSSSSPAAALDQPAPSTLLENTEEQEVSAAASSRQVVEAMDELMVKVDNLIEAATPLDGAELTVEGGASVLAVAE